MKLFPYTSECADNCFLKLESVPGADKWPRRLVCAEHGYPQERRTNTIAAVPEREKVNDYVSEVCSPADIQEIGGTQVSTY